MMKLPSRLRRLDDALYDLPTDDDPMSLSELDGFLTGIVLCPVDIPCAEWLPRVWNGGDAPFDDPEDIRWFAGIVTARHDEIRRDLDRVRPQPIFDIDDRNGEVLWEAWIEGFAAAIALRPEGYAVVEPDTDAADALAGLATLTEIATDASMLTSVEINDLYGEAPERIRRDIARLHAWRMRQRGPAAAPAARPAKVGRNDPCPCGSGAKHKRCCGRG